MIDLGVRRLLRYFFGAYPGRSAVLVVLLALAGLAEGVGVATLVPMLEAVDATGTPSPVGVTISNAFQRLGMTPGVGSLLLLLVFLISTKAVFRWYAMRQVGFTMTAVAEDLRLRFVRALVGARWASFGYRKTGILANSLNAEVVAATQAYRQSCELLGALFPVLAYLTFAAWVSWEVSVGALLAGGVLLLLLRRFVISAQLASRDQVAAARSLSGQIVDIIQGLKPIRAMALENRVLPILEGEIARLRQAQERGIAARENLVVFQEPVLTLFLASAIYVLAVWLGHSLSSLIVLAFAFYRLLTHFNQAQSQYQMIVAGEAAYSSLMSEIESADRSREITHGGGAAPTALHSLEFRQVRFGYDTQTVLDGVDLEVGSGEFVVLTGASGAGKTTLVDLVAGLLEPTEGEVVVNGEDLRTMDLRDWRRRIGYVPQDMLLLNDTVRNNITLGDETIGDDEVSRALELAGAAEFVSGLPNAEESLVGEKGGALSGGQRQRIAIARALVRRPALLILDEVTTALDPETEADICRTLADLSGEVTVLAISHQPAIRRVASRTLLLSSSGLRPLEQDYDQTSTGAAHA